MPARTCGSSLGGAHLSALRSHGLTVQSGELGDFSCAVNATNEPSEIGRADVILVCVKSYDLDTAATIIRPLIGPETIVLPLQNGIDSAERLARVLGPAHMIGGVAYVVAWIASPGVIVHIGANTLVLGELLGKPTRRTEQLHQTLEDAGITAVLHPNIGVALWEKFVLMAAMGGGGALTRLPFGIVRANPRPASFSDSRWRRRLRSDEHMESPCRLTVSSSTGHVSVASMEQHGAL